MKVTFRNKQALAALLTVILLIGAFGTFDVSAQRNSRRYQQRDSRRYQQRGTQHSKTKGALIGGAVGVVGGALVGGKRGALIGAGAGAGTGYLIQRHRNNGDRRNRRYYRRY